MVELASAVLRSPECKNDMVEVLSDDNDNRRT